MVRVIVGGLVILIVQSFVFLEEETLILIASIVWLDAVGEIIRKLLEKELENKGDIIKEKFIWYLTMKERLISLLINKHEERKKIAEEIKDIYSYYIDKIVEKSIENYKRDSKIIIENEIKTDIIMTGKQVINDIALNELEKILKVVKDPTIGEKNWFGGKKII